jgi:hypothetical protein
MQAKSFLVFNSIVVFFLLLRLFMGRRGPTPTPLTIKSEPSRKPVLPPEPKGHHPGERVLSCNFQAQGQTYDAFEVLGVPSGAPEEECQRAYLDLSRHGSTERKELARLAWDALKSYFKG